MASEKRLIDANAKMIDKYLKARMISLDEALKATHNEIFWTESQQAAVRSFLLQLPKADAVEVVHGRWLKRTAVVFDDEMVGYRCSECKTTWDAETNYCPNCGAKMDGDGNG